MANEEEMDLLNKISGDRARSLVERLSQIQNRIPGSEKERLVAEKIADEMRALDLEVSLEDFKAISWEHGPARLILSNGSNKEFEVQFMPFSPPVPERGAKGNLSCLRFGFPNEYNSLSDEPKMVVIDWNEDYGSLAQMLTAAQSQKNIIALGFISQVLKGYRVDAVPMIQKPIPFPIFSLTREDGNQLRSIGEERGIIARLEGKSKIIPDATSANVIGRKMGTIEPKLRVIVSGHHDGWFSGANDNLSAVAAVLEVARALCDQETTRSLEFISFGCEEGGTEGYQYYLWGSRQYLKRHDSDLRELVCMVNAEMAGACNSKYLLVDCTPDLLPLFEVAADDISGRPSFRAGDYEMGITIPPNSQNDQLPFSWTGVPNASIYWSWFDEYHTDMDTVDVIESGRLHTFSELMLLSSYRAAQQEVPPLSLTRYARVIRVGHSDISSCLSDGSRKVNISGLDQLNRCSHGLLNFDRAFESLDSFSKAVASFERALLSNENQRPELNENLVEICQMLNRSLCRTGGIFGEDPFFLGYLSYIDELNRIGVAIEAVQKISGADISTELKSEFYPLFEPEIDVSEFDAYTEFRSLIDKREKLRSSMQDELDRIVATMCEADSKIRSTLS